MDAPCEVDLCGLSDDFLGIADMLLQAFEDAVFRRIDGFDTAALVGDAQ